MHEEEAPTQIGEKDPTLPHVALDTALHRAHVHGLTPELVDVLIRIFDTLSVAPHEPFVDFVSDLLSTRRARQAGSMEANAEWLLRDIFALLPSHGNTLRFASAIFKIASNLPFATVVRELGAQRRLLVDASFVPLACDVLISRMLSAEDVETMVDTDWLASLLVACTDIREYVRACKLLLQASKLSSSAWSRFSATPKGESACSQIIEKCILSMFMTPDDALRVSILYPDVFARVSVSLCDNSSYIGHIGRGLVGALYERESGLDAVENDLALIILANGYRRGLPCSDYHVHHIVCSRFREMILGHSGLQHAEVMCLTILWCSWDTDHHRRLSDMGLAVRVLCQNLPIKLFEKVLCQVFAELRSLNASALFHTLRLSFDDDMVCHLEDTHLISIVRTFFFEHLPTIKCGWGYALDVARTLRVELPSIMRALAHAEEVASVPSELCCPIGLEPFRYPVLCDDTYTYEMEHILRWKRESMFSPMTKQFMKSGAVYNRTAAECVSSWWNGALSSSEC